VGKLDRLSIILLLSVIGIWPSRYFPPRSGMSSRCAAAAAVLDGADDRRRSRISYIVPPVPPMGFKYASSRIVCP